MRMTNISEPRTAPAEGGETPDSLYTQATYETAIQAGAFRSGEREMNETETTFCRSLSAVARDRTSCPNFLLMLRRERSAGDVGEKERKLL